MVVNDKDAIGGQRKPIGYKVAPRNRKELRDVASECLPLLKVEGCYERGPHFLDASHLLESVLFRAGYVFHVADDTELSETAAFAIPEEHLIVIRRGVYDGLAADDPFARYTVVHEFSHIVLKHALTLHRGLLVGDHNWWEDSEWQANNLAAEMLMPVGVVKELDCRPLLIQAACGVSARAVLNRLANLQKEGLI